VVMADVKRKEVADAQKAKNEAEKLRLDALDSQQDAQNRTDDNSAETQREAMRQQGESQRAAENNESREGMNDEDNQTAITLAEMEIGSKEELAKAQDFGPNPDQNFNSDFNPDRNPKP